MTYLKSNERYKREDNDIEILSAHTQKLKNKHNINKSCQYYYSNDTAFNNIYDL